jgi:hypothetical protein
MDGTFVGHANQKTPPTYQAIHREFPDATRAFSVGNVPNLLMNSKAVFGSGGNFLQENQPRERSFNQEVSGSNPDALTNKINYNCGSQMIRTSGLVTRERPTNAFPYP